MKKTKREDNINKPWVSNYPPLKEWLDKNGAQCMDQMPYGNPDSPAAYFEKWMTPNGRIFLIEVRANQMGWDIFTPGPSSEIAATLNDANDRLGLTR